MAVSEVVKEEARFVAKYPELKDYTPYLRGTYRACSAVQIGDGVVELQEAYDHIFVKGCARCKRNFGNLHASVAKLLATWPTQ